MTKRAPPSLGSAHVWILVGMAIVVLVGGGLGLYRSVKLGERDRATAVHVAPEPHLRLP
ncbi:MAG: hypothetical protein ACOYKM_04915 [Caulobacterales bacterium]